MTILAAILGTLLPAFLGAATLRALEARAVVLGRMERLFLGYVLGCTLLSFALFVLQLAGLPLQWWTIVLAVLIPWLALVPLLRRYRKAGSERLSPSVTSALQPWQWAIVGVLVVWIVVKVSAGAVLLFTSPPFHDDVINNWNLRTKVYYERQAILPEAGPKADPYISAGIHSYPPSVPLIKASYPLLALTWSDWLIQLPHLLWFLCGIGIVFSALRRTLSLQWSLAGAYLYSSLPLLLMHGTVAYADLFVSLHIFTVLLSLISALRIREAGIQTSLLRIGGLALALLPFTKNEGLALYLPALLLLSGLTLWFGWRKGYFSTTVLRRSLLPTLVLLAVILVPWLLYKWSWGLPFGNAKAVSGLQFGWQGGESVQAIYAMWITTFFEGNWILLFPLLLGLIAFCWRTAFRSPLVVLTSFILAIWFGQAALFVLTSLSTEAIRQTGYARGLLQLSPAAVALVTLLAAHCFGRRSPENNRT